MSKNKKYHDIDCKIYEIACQEIYNSLDSIKFQDTELYYEEYCYAKYKFRLYTLEQFVAKILSNDEIPFVLISNQEGINDYNVSSIGKMYFKKCLILLNSSIYCRQIIITMNSSMFLLLVVNLWIC